MLKYNYSNQLLLNYLTNPSSKRIERMLNCGRQILKNSSDKKTTIYCHDPLCLQCQDAKKRKENSMVFKIIPKIIDEYKFCFMTITFPSVHISEYNKTIKKLHKIFNKLCLSNELINNIKGYLSKIDYKKINHAGKVNLHIHSVLMLLKDYIFNIGMIKSLINNISVKLFGIEIEDIDIQQPPKEEIPACCNYCVKPIQYFHSKSDLMNYANIIDEQRKNIKLYGYGGIYKKMRSQIIKNNKNENTGLSGKYIFK